MAIRHYRKYVSLLTCRAITVCVWPADQLRQVLLGVMRSKDSLEAEVREMKKQQSEAESQNDAATVAADGAAQGSAEELQVKSKRVSALEKENSLLKQQLKKYVAEAQQLKRQNRELIEAQSAAPDNSDASKEAPDRLDRNFSGLDHMQAEEDEDGDGDDSVPGGYASIEDMQAHHERQILQLADMHCELIDLNERANVRHHACQI